MTGFMEGKDRRDRLLLPDGLDDYVSGDNQVRVVDVFVDELDLRTFGFAGPAATGRPGYSPATMLKLYLYGYLHLVQIAVEVELEHFRRAIPGSTGCGRPRKAKCPQIQLVDKHIYDPNLVVPADIVIQAIGKQQSVPPVFPLHKASHTKSLGSPRRDYHIGCFHTGAPGDRQGVGGASPLR